MIIGNGDIASVLPDRDDLVFFASGVSNSQEVRQNEYKREYQLLLEQDKKKHIVYFGTLSIFYANTTYTKHKKQMEEVVKHVFDHYTIIRLGNITWGNNPHTFINFMRAKMDKGEPFFIKDEYRYIIDKDEFLHWINLIPYWNCEMNLTGKKLKVKDIIAEYCGFQRLPL